MAGGIFLLAGCSGEPKTEPADLLARVGNARITLTEVRRQMPGGLSPEDSARFVKAFVNEWVDNRLVSEIASEEVDMTEINRLVEDYRQSLISAQYRRKMYETHADAIPDDSIKAYYEAHKTDFVLERPMVMGTYLKAPDDARNLRTLKRLYSSEKQVDTDRLEKEVLSSAIHYDYFRNRWVDWEQIESKIPFDFGKSQDSWLSKNRRLEYSSGGFTYLLYITAVLPAGSPQPLEAARAQIINRLIAADRKAYDAELLQGLYTRAKESGRLKVNL